MFSKIFLVINLFAYSFGVTVHTYPELRSGFVDDNNYRNNPAPLYAEFEPRRGLVNNYNDLPKHNAAYAVREPQPGPVDKPSHLFLPRPVSLYPVTLRPPNADRLNRNDFKSVPLPKSVVYIADDAPSLVDKVVYKKPVLFEIYDGHGYKS
ncbi:hypothetical protein GWI33_004822 [Rhynchophorus ferrugineus]|uniref:Uncharacterized protein n=1 Tax=Rhynchophorus ferrugineus TaxID=354439 RepID=A0A834IIA4_RHYFE|nr:hypothetical protein GWI33_004822 [Rhynchophorus ferrugineus]